MGFRRVAGGAGLARRSLGGLASVVAAAVGLIAAGCVLAQAQGPRVLDHHAIVLNGRIVGSAFMIAADLAVTNAHVVEGLRPGGTVTLVSEARGGEAAARVVAISPRMDLAVLRAPAGFLPVVSPRDAPRRAGMPVRGAGIDASGGRGLGPRLELEGVVAAADTTLGAYGPGLVIAMPGVRPGFSGGPVLDAEGRLVGMITAIRASGAAQAARASGGEGAGRRPPDEAFVLRADAIRREAARLLRAAGG